MSALLATYVMDDINIEFDKPNWQIDQAEPEDEFKS